MIQPPPASGSATAEVEVCRPLPTPVTRAGGPLGVRHQRVDQGRLADARSARSSPTPSWPVARGPPRAGHRAAAVGGGARRVTSTGRSRSAYDAMQRGRVGEVGLGQHQHRIQVAGVGGDQAAVDETGARHRVRQCADDHQLVGVGHQHPFRRVGVVGGSSAEHASSAAPRSGRSGRACPARRRCRRPGRPGRRPRPRGGRVPGPAWRSPVRALRARVDQAGVPAAVDRGDEPARPRRRAPAGSWSAGGLPRAGRTRTSSLSQLFGEPAQRVTATDADRARPSMSPTSGRSPGRVLAVVPMSSTTTPGTRSPTMAPAVAIRWSAYDRHRPPCRAAGRIVRRVPVLDDIAAERGDVGRRARPAGRSRGRAGDRCRAAGWGGRRTAASGGDGRGQLSDVVQVDVDAASAGPAR